MNESSWHDKPHQEQYQVGLAHNVFRIAKRVDSINYVAIHNIDELQLRCLHLKQNPAYLPYLSFFGGRMKKHLITILTLSSALYISNANASGYMKASINSISPSEAKYTLSGVDNFTNYKIGYGGSVELGQYLAEKLHTSIEASYGEAEIEEPSFNNYKAKILALMLNANYDFVTEDNITIYGQIGAGSASALDNNKAKTFKPAWQTGAGARYQYNSSTDLVLGYKYFAIPDGFKIANSGIEFENYTAHNVELGLQFNF